MKTNDKRPAIDLMRPRIYDQGKWAAHPQEPRIQSSTVCPGLVKTRWRGALQDFVGLPGKYSSVCLIEARQSARINQWDIGAVCSTTCLTTSFLTLQQLRLKVPKESVRPLPTANEPTLCLP